jgi:DNA-binding phage protein
VAQEKTMTTKLKHDNWPLEKLQDAEFAAEFLYAAGEDDDTKTYLTALKKVVDARGGGKGTLV